MTQDKNAKQSLEIAYQNFENKETGDRVQVEVTSKAIRIRAPMIPWVF